MLILDTALTRTHTLFAVCLLTTFSSLLIAAPQDEAADEQEMDTPAIADPAPLHNLEGISLEERIQLRRDLMMYSRAVDPSHIQIEEQRRIMRKRIQERFLGSDKDNDGTISREEAAETLPQIFRHFTQVDINDDGVISLSELEAAQARAIERRRAAEAKIEAAQSADDLLKNKGKNKQAASNGKSDL